MPKVLVDSSVWIDFFNKKDVEHANKLSYLLKLDNAICLCPTIVQEVLQGIKNDALF